MGGILGDFFAHPERSKRHPLEARDEIEFHWFLCQTWRANVGTFVPGDDYWRDGYVEYHAGWLNPPTVH